MSNNNAPRWQEHTDDEPPPDEGGLYAPAHLGFWGKAWWWFDFVILVKLARLRFIAILVVIGLIIVKWDLLTAYYEKWTRPTDHAHVAGSDFEFYCPMHPTVIRDTPKDKCPICFMPLSKRKKGDGKEEALPPGIVNRVQLSPYRVVLAGIKTHKVAYEPLTKEITTVGFVEFNERELKHVAARVKARIDKLYVNETGQFVRADQELASLYSPELIVTVQNLIDANRNANASLEESTRDRLRLWGINDRQMDMVIAVQNLIDGMRKGDKALHDLAHKQLKKLENGDKFGKALHNLLEGQRTNDAALIKEARPQLVELNMHEDQIDDVLETGKAIRHLIIRSPIKGHVLKKYVKEGQYVDEGSPLYDVVDLNTVWIQAQVYEEDMAFLPVQHRALKKNEAAKKGLPITASTRALPGETFEGHLTFVFPHVDQDTRTITVRYELDNPDHKLRPGTSVTVKLNIPPKQLEIFKKNTTDVQKALLDKGLILAVPDSAVIDTGDLQIVYREIGPGEYEGVKVELGPRMPGPLGTYYPVLRGLDAGDIVITSGSFLVDAETRLNPAAGSIYFGGSGGKTSSVSTVKPSTPDDEEAKITAAMAKLSDADRKLAQGQRLCPILKDSPLGSMGVPVKLMVQDQPVFLCCKGCEKGAMANPKKTIEDVAKLRAAHK